MQSTRKRRAQFSSYEFVFGSGELTRSGIRLRLEKQPAELLELLILANGELVSRHGLIAALWPGETEGEFDRRLDKAVAKLRASLNEDPAKPRFIETLKGRGYRFIADFEILNENRSSPGRTNSIEARLVSPDDHGGGPVKEAPEPGDSFAPGGEHEPRLSKEVVTTAIGSEHALGQSIAGQELERFDKRVAGNRAASVPLFRLLWVAIALALLITGLWFQRSAIGRNRATEIHSIAVLPLRNLSPDPGQDYFADGVTEDLITNLAQSLPLRVISRTSMMRYKDSAEPVRQIGRDLQVDAIVEGAVARSGRRVTITVQLIDAAQDRHLWARKYDRQAEDLLDVEAEVSREIANQIDGTLAARRIVRGSEIRAIDPETYELCLLGRFHWNKRTAADLVKAADYYQQAIARDPNYAPAYAGLANVYAVMPSYDSVPIQEAFTKGMAAARRAINLDPSLAEPYATLGFIELNGADWTRAGAELQHALELNPNLATAHHWLAYNLLFLGQANDAIAEVESARRLDPLSVIINAAEGQLLYVVRRYGEAATRLRQAIELSPDNGQAYETLALTELETGDSTDAIKEARAGLALSATNPRTLGEAGYVLARTGHAAEARGLLRTLDGIAPRDSVQPVYLAMIYVGLNQPHQAVEQLQLHARMFGGLRGIWQWHAFDLLSHDPRYEALFVAGDVATMESGSRPLGPSAGHSRTR